VLDENIKAEITKEGRERRQHFLAKNFKENKETKSELNWGELKKNT
jgi:hypothetical protein